MISVVCPFYNEESILEASIALMIKNLSTLKDEWELIVVDDGSRDGSLEIVKRAEQKFAQLRVVHYTLNRGRGYAIRRGVGEARGDLVITTEIDCSWGNDIVHRIVEEFHKRPDADIIIASPHLPGGSYKNVPPHRVFLSSFGNRIIRTGLTNSVTMNTGMTRGYKREKFMDLPLDEDEKEQHLEIVSKALAFGYRIYEIPAVLEWKDHRLAKTGTKRKSSANIAKLIRTHLTFSLIAAPFRYIFIVSLLLLAGALVFGLLGVRNLFTEDPSIYYVLTGFFLGLFSFLIFAIGLLAHQGIALQHQLWRIRYYLRQIPIDRRKQN